MVDYCTKTKREKRIAAYNQRKKNGMCIENSCIFKAVKGKVRCKKHLYKYTLYQKGKKIYNKNKNYKK